MGGRVARGTARAGTAAGAIAAALACAAAATAHAPEQHRELPSLIPAKDRHNYRTVVRGVVPPVRGVDVEVLAEDERAGGRGRSRGGDDRLVLVNASGRTVVIHGYEGEPFLRLLAGGGLDLNARSPSAYTSQERFGRMHVPKDADASAPPRWYPLSAATPSGRGAAEWFDHRTHWMRAERPAKVGDGSARVKLRDWSVPITVGKRKARVVGSLWWVPDADESVRGGDPPEGPVTGHAGREHAAAGAPDASRRPSERRSAAQTRGPPAPVQDAGAGLLPGVLLAVAALAGLGALAAARRGRRRDDLGDET